MIYYRGRIFDVVTQRRRLPNGHTVRLEFIRHPGAVLIVPFLSRDKIVFLKQFRPVINDTIYELPAGKREKGEQPLDCARREIVEEIHYTAGKIKKLGVLYPVPGYSTEKIVIYKAEDLKTKKGRRDDDEIIETCLLTKEQIKSLFKEGKMIDAKTISALVLCGWFN